MNCVRLVRQQYRNQASGDWRGGQLQQSNTGLDVDTSYLEIYTVNFCSLRAGTIKVKELKNVFSSYGHEFFLNNSDIGTSEVYTALPCALRGRDSDNIRTGTRITESR